MNDDKIGSYTFEYSDSELRQVWKEREEQISSLFAIVKWLQRRNGLDCPEMMHAMQAILNDLEKLGGAENYLAKPSHHIFCGAISYSQKTDDPKTVEQ